MRDSRLLRPAPLILAALSLAACTRSAGDIAPAELPTQLAQTLTAAPTLPPSATPPPSATAEPTTTLSPTVTATQTETVTPGPSPTPTGPPLQPGDPRQGINLSSPDHRDDFSAPFTWFANFSNASAEIMLEDQKLRTTDRRADTLITWSTSGETGGDVYVEVSAEIAACSGKDAAGLAIRIGNANYDRGYALEVSCDGQYRIRKFISFNTVPAILLDWTASDAIRPGPNASNRLALLARGSTIQALVNGEALGQVEDPDFIFGNFGLYTDAVDTPDLTVLWDDFSLWRLTP